MSLFLGRLIYLKVNIMPFLKTFKYVASIAIIAIGTNLQAKSYTVTIENWTDQTICGQFSYQGCRAFSGSHVVRSLPDLAPSKPNATSSTTVNLDTDCDWKLAVGNNGGCSNMGTFGLKGGTRTIKVVTVTTMTGSPGNYTYGSHYDVQQS